MFNAKLKRVINTSLRSRSGVRLTTGQKARNKLIDNIIYKLYSVIGFFQGLKVNNINTKLK